MFKSIFKFFANKMSCASIFGAQGINMLKNNLMLEAASAELTDAGLATGSVLSQLIEIFVDLINSWIYIVAKYILMFVDFCQVITYKIAGIDNDLENIVNMPIFKLILNDTVLKVIGTVLVIGLILLILATIVAIVKSEYEAALEDKKDAKSTAYKTIGKSCMALFMMVITPFLIIVAIIFSSVVLSSANNVLNSNDSETATIGGTLFTTAAYNANKYRLYAADGKRIPIILNFDDPYEDGTYGFYTAEQLKEIYDGWNGEEIYNDFATKNFMNFNETLTYRDGKIYNSNDYSDYERFVATSEQYQVMADFIDYAISHEITYYIKDSRDNQIDWNRSGSAIKISDGVYDPVNKTITITYTDESNLSPYEDYYTITFETSSASADTPIANAVSTISLLLGLNTLVNGGTVSKVSNTNNVVGPVNMTITNSSLTNTAQGIEDALQELSSSVNKTSGAVNFRVLERVKGSTNLVRWKTEKAIYNGREYTVYELKKVMKNTQTGINETKATVKVAKRDDSLNSKYYVVSEELNKFGYYDYTNVTIDYFNDGKMYLDTLTPVFKLVAWPEKLYNDLKVIYSDIDFDSYIAYDNWSDALGSYFKTNNNVSDADVSSFATTLIHPLGLIMSELFLGTTIEGGNNDTASFKFASAYMDDMIESIALSVGGQFDYANIKYQIDNFMRLFNGQFASVIESLMEYENFDLYGNDPYSCQAYVYKAYLASIMLSDGYSDYLYDVASTLLSSEKLLDIMSLGANSVTYDENGNPVYKIEILTNQDGTYQTLYYEGNNTAGKAVYDKNGKLQYTTGIDGKLAPDGLFVPKAGVVCEIFYNRDFNYYYYLVYDADSAEFVPSTDMVTDKEYEDFLQEVEDGTKTMDEKPLKFTDFFTTYFEMNASETVVYVYEPDDSDTSKANNIVSPVMLTADATEIGIIKNQLDHLINGVGTLTQSTVLRDYCLYEVEKVLDVDSSYLTYGELPAIYQNFIDNMIIKIEQDAQKGMYEEPAFLQFIREYKEDGAGMIDVMSAESISASTAKQYLKDYDYIVRQIDNYTEMLSQPLDANELVRAYRTLQLYKDRLNKLKKYYIVYGIESYASTQVSAGFTVIVNSHAFHVSQGMVQRELLEIILGNRLTFDTLIGKISNNTPFDSLGEYDKLSFDQISAFVNYYIGKINRLCQGTTKSAKLFSGKLTDAELDIINKVYATKMGINKGFTNKTLKSMTSQDKEELRRTLSLLMQDAKVLMDNYTSGVTINTGTSYALTIDESFALLADLFRMGVEDEQLYFVKSDYTGIIGDDLGGFGQLKKFLKNFGDLCFDLSRESNLGGVGQHETENILDYIDSLVSVLMQNLSALNLGNSFEKFDVIEGHEDLKTFAGQNVDTSTKFVVLNSQSKEYIYRLYELYDLKVSEYQSLLATYKDARDYSSRYINGRYAMQSDSFIFATGVKEYLNYFRYHTDIDDTDFKDKYVYDTYLGSVEETEDRLHYYNQYLEAFDNVILGTNGIYFENLTDLQQKVIKDMYEYYKSAYEEFSKNTNPEYSQNLYNRQLLHDFIFKNTTLGAFLHPDDIITTVAQVTTINELFDANVDLLNLYNILDYVGLDYDINKSLADYRLDALNSLITFKERGGESGAAIQARYLTLLYLVCADYTTNTFGETTIQVDSSTKATILKLAGLENKAEEHLVGLKYEVLSTDSISDEKFGSVFIICTYNAETDMYEPVVFGSDRDDFGTPRTEYYSSTDSKIKYYPIIAKGVIGPDGLPTAIREVNGYIEFYRENATIVNSAEMGLNMYYMSTEDISINYNPISVVANMLSSIFTGKSLAEHILEAIPVIVSSKDMNFAYGSTTSYVYHLQGGEFTLNYMFYKDTGIQMNCLYSAANLNSLILSLGTVILAFSLISAMFGVIRNLYELALIVIIYPGVLAMYPLNDGLQGNWRKEFIDKLLVMLSFIIAINGFFLILNLLQRMEITLVLSAESVAELKTTYLFGKFNMVSIISTLMTFMMFIVSCTLLKTLPKLFSKIAGVGGDVIKKGDGTRAVARVNLEEAIYFSSGYAVEDMVMSKFDKIKALPLIGSDSRALAREKRQMAANKRAVGQYRSQLENVGKQKLMAENLDKYEKRLRRSGRFTNAQIDSMKKKYQASMESKDFESLVQESVGAYKRRLARMGVSPAKINAAAAAYEDRIRGMQLSNGAIDDAVKAYETSLNRQLEAQHNRRFNDKDARTARIRARVQRLMSKEGIINKEHYEDKKKVDKVCPNCRTVCKGKSKNCPKCGHKF